jgi:hypothetical protein
MAQFLQRLSIRRRCHRVILLAMSLCVMLPSKIVRLEVGRSIHTQISHTIKSHSVHSPLVTRSVSLMMTRAEQFSTLMQPTLVKSRTDLSTASVKSHFQTERNYLVSFPWDSRYLVPRSGQTGLNMRVSSVMEKSPGMVCASMNTGFTKASL